MSASHGVPSGARLLASGYTLSADGRTLATVLTKRSANIYILSGNDSGGVKPLLSHANDIIAFNWTADGNLLATDSGRLLKLAVDGKNQTQLLADSSAAMAGPAACGANYFVFAWYFRGNIPWGNIWRTNTDGSSPLKLTNGKADGFPVCSPDQKWVYYWDPYDGANVLRVPLDGSGKPEAVPGSSSISSPALTGPGVVSRDGKTLARVVQVLNPKTQDYQNKIALLNLESSTAVRMLDVSEHLEESIDTWAGAEFTPDGKAVAYTIRENGVDNIWMQPLDGSVGHQITNFKSEQISLFHWSPDGEEARDTARALRFRRGSPARIQTVGSYCGQKDAAVRLLRSAIEQNYCAYTALQTDPLLAKLRGTPEFSELLSAAKDCQNKFLAGRDKDAHIKDATPTSPF